MSTEKKKKSGESWQMHIVKREMLSRPRAWGIRLAAIAIALVLCALLIYSITKLNPVKVYVSMFKGAFRGSLRTWNTIRDTMVLLCISLGLAPAFKMKFWNIGAEGQVLVGGIATAACMIYLGNQLPLPLLLVVMFVASCLAGAVWGLIPALFKAKWNTNETLFTLMMNYIAIQLTAYFVALWENPYGSNSVGLINPDTHGGWFPPLFGMDYLLNVILVLALTVGMYFYLRNSKQGYEIAVVGDSENTARYVGMNVKRIILRTMIISGAICGLAGCIAVAGTSHTISTEIGGGRGFTAIIVAWMSKFNAFGMIAYSFLLVFLEKGAMQIASDFGLNNETSEIMKGIILFVVLGSEFFLNYKISFRKISAKEEKNA
ncbi:MAG: ABC transporter permease [Clostridia bacterium]|nr:ABC transporter permease [Clostridia bacterium]